MASIGVRQAAPGRFGHSTGMLSYALAILVTVLSLAVRAAFDPVLGSYAPYLTIFPAVIFSAWYCGFWPSILATLLAFLGETYWFIEPRRTLAISSPEIAIGGFIYLFAALFIIWFAESQPAGHG